jgi:hypothetical protein
MIIDTVQERLLVISDLHVGNPYSAATRNLGEFFEFAESGRYNVCINGDGFEILQARFASLATESASVLRGIRRQPAVPRAFRCRRDGQRCVAPWRAQARPD